jgi:hypothetical protein
MKSALKAFGLVALSATIAHAGTDQKDLKKVIEDQGINYVETAQKGITLSGYVDTSYTEQFGGRGTGFGGSSSPAAVSTVGSGTQANLHQFDVNNNNFNINAVKIALEKALPDKNEWAAGFRIDTMYGQDANILSKADPILGTGSVALEQALVKFRIPVGNGLDVYMGKFVTLLGYEVIESPANPNFSRGLLFTNAIPLTHTGIYADYKFNDTFEAKFGIVDGWNESISPGVSSLGGTTDSANDYPFGGKAITGQLNINAPGKNANITQSFIYSPSGENPDGPAGFGGTDNGPVAVYDIWGNWNPTFDKGGNTTLGFNVDFGYNGASGIPSQTLAQGGVAAPVPPGVGVTDSNTWWGAALYAQYKLNKTVTLAARGEYLHEDSAINPKFGVAGVSNDDFSETLTASFNIWDNLLTRVEYRYDHLTNGTTNPFVAGGVNANVIGTYTNQDEISVEAVYSF